MRVAFVDQSSQMGGVEYSTLWVAQALDKGRFTPVILCPEEGDLPRLARQADVEVQIVSRPKTFSVSFLRGRQYIINPFGFLATAVNTVRAARGLEQFLRRTPADLIVTKGLLAHFYGGLAARKLNIPCIWYVQEEVDPGRAGGLYQRIFRFYAKRLPDKIVVDAEALLEQFSQGSESSLKPLVVYNGVDTDQFLPAMPEEKIQAQKRLGIPEKSLVIGQAGRLIPLKGQNVLIQAFAQLTRKYPQIHLLLVGGPLFGSQTYAQSLEDLVHQLGLSEKVTFTGFLPDVRAGLAAMDIFTYSSLETDSPLGIMEAMACGLPVIVSRVRGTIEMVTSDVDALCVEPGNVFALAEGLEQLIQSPQQRSKLAENARRSAEERFSLSASVMKVESLLEELHAN